jgi:hypothetical protein
MADLIQKVILEVEVNTGELINEQVKLRGSIEDVRSELTKLREQRKVMEEWQQSTEAVDKDIIKLEGSLRNLNQQQKNLQKQVDISTKANQAQSGSYEQLLRQWELASIKLKTLEGTLKQNEDGTFALTEEYRAQSKAVGDAKEALDTFNLTISDGRTNVGQYGKALEPIKAELKELNQTQQALNKTMLGLNALQEASTQVLGENTVANNTLKSAISAMVVVQNLGNIRQGVTASLMLATQVQSKALTAATIAQTTATGLFAGIQTFLQIQLGLSAAAARAFAVAIAATGIGALVVALGLAVSAITSYLTRTKEATKETDTWAKTIEDATKSFKASIDLLNTTVDEGNKKIFDNLQTQIELVKLRGGTLTQVYNMEAELIDRRLEFLKKSGNADTAQYQELLNDKLVLTAQYFRDLEQQRREADASFTATKLPTATDLIPEQEPELLKEIAKAAFKISLEEDTQRSLQEIRDRNLEIAESDNFKAAESISNTILGFATARAQQQTDIEIAELEERLRIGQITQDKFNKEKKKLLTEEAKQSKTLAVFNSVVNGIAAIIKAGGLFSPQGIATALSVAAQTALLLAQPIPKFEQGGMKSGIFGGKPHSSGGTKGYFDDGTRVEVEKDEMFAVVNKRSTGLLGSLSMINQMGGGIDFFKHAPANYLADGGFAARSVSDPVISSFNSDQLVNAIREMQIFVNVTDINSLNNKKATVIERSTV